MPHCLETLEFNYYVIFFFFDVKSDSSLRIVTQSSWIKYISNSDLYLLFVAITPRTTLLQVSITLH